MTYAKPNNSACDRWRGRRCGCLRAELLDQGVLGAILRGLQKLA
jgi:hypothetical protein